MEKESKKEKKDRIFGWLEEHPGNDFPIWYNTLPEDEKKIFVEIIKERNEK